MESISLSFAVYGVAIVISLAVAVLIKGIVLALPYFDRKPEAPPAPAAVPDDGVPAAHVAAIAAAISAVVRDYRIIHIDDYAGHHEWTAEGRMVHQTQHNIPHGRR